MTTRRLFERLRSVPDDASERVVRSVMMRAIRPRLTLGLVVLALWKWLVRTFFQIEPAAIERLMNHAGTAMIAVAALYPLLRILKMDDAEFDREIGAARGNPDGPAGRSNAGQSCYADPGDHGGCDAFAVDG